MLSRHQPVFHLVMSLSVMAVLLSGCMTPGPAYHVPEAPVPQYWKAEGGMGQWKTAEPADDRPRGQWWTIFQDDVLNDLQRQAVRHNQGLKSAAASVARARAVARITKGDLFPSLDLNPEYERSRRSGTVSSTSGGARGTVSESYDVPLDFHYELDIWGRVRRSFEAGVADMQAAGAAYQTVLLTLTADVARFYFTLRELDKEIDVLSEAIILRQQALEVVQKRVDGGITSELDLNQARTELARAQAAIVDVERRRREMENALAVLCGQSASTFRLDHASLDVKPPVIPVDLPSTLLERRPDIAEAERRVAAANARVGVAEVAAFPVITLTGSAGYASASTGHLLDWASRVWSFGPGISMPLFAGGKNKANLDAARADYARTVADYRNTVLEAIAEAETALSNLDMRARQAQAQQEVVTAARASAVLAMSRYRQGLVTFLEVIDPERQRLDAELAATQILNQRLISAVQLIKALGGGWDE